MLHFKIRFLALLISDNLESKLWYPQFLQKTNEQIRLYHYDTSGRLFFVHFLEEIEDTKKTFRNQLTFRKCHKSSTVL